MTEAISGRRCLSCDAVVPVAADQPVWPLDARCPACAHVIEQREGIASFAPELADTISGFDPKAFDELAALEPGHFWFVARNELIVGLAGKYFPQARRFLEVGCGTGFVLRGIANARDWDRLAGSELHPSGLVHARKRLPETVELVQMDARNIPAAGLFDLIGAFDVIEHIADDEAVLRAMRGATASGGGAIIAVPQHRWLWSRSDEVAHHERRYERGELEQKLRRNGFEVLFSSSFTALLLPLMVASRALGRGKQSSESVNHEFMLDHRINGLLTAILRTEVRITLAGLAWPAGGSRVVVARAV
ncbi:class I SAM-dependent methyltransferase [Bradyrhizobium sp. YR681]|uniref:class I SAM-dependent methyltransferase n=1 Tax=Bradyrhizobium sp. YR681 TaxID=1144344 RepID=UPI0012F6F983|nr:class I SAM-dependent methyltransferase [Bradyrhizobium sp. YR681]